MGSVLLCWLATSLASGWTLRFMSGWCLVLWVRAMAHLLYMLPAAPFHHGALLGLFSFDTANALSRMGQPLLQTLCFLVLDQHGV